MSNQAKLELLSVKGTFVSILDSKGTTMSIMYLDDENLVDVVQSKDGVTPPSEYLNEVELGADLEAMYDDEDIISPSSIPEMEMFIAAMENLQKNKPKNLQKNKYRRARTNAMNDPKYTEKLQKQIDVEKEVEANKKLEEATKEVKEIASRVSAIPTPQDIMIAQASQGGGFVPPMPVMPMGIGNTIPNPFTINPNAPDIKEGDILTNKNNTKVITVKKYDEEWESFEADVYDPVKDENLPPVYLHKSVLVQGNFILLPPVTGLLIKNINKFKSNEKSRKSFEEEFDD